MANLSIANILLNLNNFLINTYLYDENLHYLPLQILSFSRNFRRFKMKNFICRSTMAADNISYVVDPHNGPALFHFKSSYCF